MNDRIKIEIGRDELSVMKKMVLINHALGQVLEDPKASADQKAMTRAFNEIVLRADVASMVSA